MTGSNSHHCTMPDKVGAVGPLCSGFSRFCEGWTNRTSLNLFDVRLMLPLVTEVKMIYVKADIQTDVFASQDTGVHANFMRSRR